MFFGFAIEKCLAVFHLLIYVVKTPLNISINPSQLLNSTLLS